MRILSLSVYLVAGVALSAHGRAREGTGGEGVPASASGRAVGTAVTSGRNTVPPPRTHAGYSGAWWRPTPGTSWQIQFTGPHDTSYAVQAYDLDLFDTPVSTIDALHGRGIRVICYMSGGSYEEWRPDAYRFPASALGKELDGWPGERWVDIRSATVRSIMKARMDLAVRKRCDALDVDNVDSYTHDTGFPLTYANQLDYNRFMATEAHLRSLAIGLKNDLDQVPELVGSYDFAINEQCFQYSECDRLRPFIQANKAVFQIEYGGRALADAICPKARAMNLDTLIKQLELGPERISCR